MALRRRRTYSSSVTEEQTVEGGLAEPKELEPDQGSLDLAAPEDIHDRAEWEAAAAAVLRKARRLTDKLPEQFRLGLVTFSDFAEVQAPPTTDRDAVKGGLDRLRAAAPTRSAARARAPVVDADAGTLA